MKLNFLILLLVFAPGSAKLLNAQDAKTKTASDTLVVLWSSGDPEVAEKACLMYTGEAKNMAGSWSYFRSVYCMLQHVWCHK